MLRFKPYGYEALQLKSLAGVVAAELEADGAPEGGIGSPGRALQVRNPASHKSTVLAIFFSILQHEQVSMQDSMPKPTLAWLAHGCLFTVVNLHGHTWPWRYCILGFGLE